MSLVCFLQSFLQSTEPKIPEEYLIIVVWSLGYSHLKPNYHCAVTELLRGRDTFVTLPIGYGKSLIYQVLPACARKILFSFQPISVSAEGEPRS